ncbi:MAG: zinc-dependent metalloprotease [Steroidobacteraceae bacterium]
MTPLKKLAVPAIVLLSVLAPLLAPVAASMDQPPAREWNCEPSTRMNRTVTLHRTDLGKKFLLQVSYERRRYGRHDFMTSRSHIVTFAQRGGVVQMLEDVRDPGASPAPLASIPVQGMTQDALLLDFNTGFDRILNEEDRTGKDYYQGEETRDASFFPVLQCAAARVSRAGPILVIEQRALSGDDPVSVYYYLSPYRPDPQFEPFELEDLDHFGFYQTYPRLLSGRNVFHATKFDGRKPIVFALSTAIPAARRAAVRDGVLYWNRAMGHEMLRVIDAPAGVTVPNPSFNIIEWITDGALGSNSHIQDDPLTGQILHAHIFLDAHGLPRRLDEQDDFLRYIVAHEVGHALGLRHNFAKGPPTTVMNYFNFTEGAALGRAIRMGTDGFEYDRKVMRHVYLDEPLDLASLPPFCTDYQPGCRFFPVKSDLDGRKSVHSGPAGH